MNRYGSVLALAARHTVYKVLAVTAAAAALTGWLLVRLPILKENPYPGAEPLLVPRKLESLPSESLATVACLVGFLAILAVLSLNGCGFGAKSDYTVRRLRLEEQRAELLWAGYYTACLVFYWAVMAAVCCWAVGQRLTLLAADADYGSLAGPQSRLLVFYSSPFLHHLLPLADVAVWAEDIALAALCGTAAVRFSRRQRRGRLSMAPLIAAGLTVVGFSLGMESTGNYVLPILAVGLAAFNMLMKGAEEDEPAVTEGA